MNAELSEFRKPFKTLAAWFADLAIEPTFLDSIHASLDKLQAEAEYWATRDFITFALNKRGEAWYVSNERVLSIGKIDLYDMRQANRVYGVEAVDDELCRIAFILQKTFPMDDGYLVCRSSGSDEYKIISMLDPPDILKSKLTQLHEQDVSESLMPWDYGAGLSEEEAEAYLYRQKSELRPIVVRSPSIDNHSELSIRTKKNNIVPGFEDFRKPYDDLKAYLYTGKLPPSVVAQAKTQIAELQTHAENAITTDYLTGALNYYGKQWYVEKNKDQIKSIALTDVSNMHEGNLRYGCLQVDQDLKRLASVLLAISKNDGDIYVARSSRAGDEFYVYSSEHDVQQLLTILSKVNELDASKALLEWDFGVGKSEAEARYNIYKSRALPGLSSKHPSVLPSEGTSVFLIVHPLGKDYQRIYSLGKQVAGLLDGEPTEDLHLTFFTLRKVSEFSAFIGSLREYFQNLRPFRIEIEALARMSLDNMPGRMWLLAKKSPNIEKIYNDLLTIAQMTGNSLAYPYTEWKPHIKIATIPSHTPPLNINIDVELDFEVRFFEITQQINQNEWKVVNRFSIVD